MKVYKCCLVFALEHRSLFMFNTGFELPNLCKTCNVYCCTTKEIDDIEIGTQPWLSKGS